MFYQVLYAGDEFDSEQSVRRVVEYRIMWDIFVQEKYAEGITVGK